VKSAIGQTVPTPLGCHPTFILANSRRAASGQDSFLRPRMIVPGPAWRSFSASLDGENSLIISSIIFRHCPTTTGDPPSTASRGASARWQRGQTGYPFVDAGMRQLWQTGWMHNRVRMIAASFLTKHLRIDWRVGEAWFWDTLVDADLANNAAGWQWVAGSGADAAPFFRIFNPTIQGRKFDPDGDYVRHWCPELANLPGDLIHAPFEVDADTLARAGVIFGKSYPAPIVDHWSARKAALDAYQAIV
jgi:deoxyribodipyrimidine photolyase